jgi:hypothetical protein
MLKGDFQFEPYGSDDTADRDRQRQEGDSFILGLTNLAKVFPGLQPLMMNPEVTKAVLEHLLRAYDVRDKQPFLGALQAPGLPPQMGAGMSPSPAGMPSGAPAPRPGGPPPDLGALIAHLTSGGTIAGNDQPTGAY